MKTFEHPEKSGIVVAEILNKKPGKNFGVSWQVRIPSKLTGGARERAQFPGKVAAFKFAEDRFLALKKFGTSFAEFPPAQQQEALAAWQILKDTGIGFVEAVKTGLRVLRPDGGIKKVSEVVDELVASKEARSQKGEIDSRTVDTFKQYTKSIVSEYGEKVVSALTVDDVKAFLEGIRERLSQRSTKNYRNVFSEILRHAKASRYTSENVMDYFTREDNARLGGEKASRKASNISILSVEDAGKLLRAAAAQEGRPLLATLTLRLFCGIRTAEVFKLRWEDVHWKEEKPYVYISELIAKKRRVRNVDIPQNVIAWLALCDSKTGPVSPGDEERLYIMRVTNFAKSAGVGLSSNATRHSYGSYHFALHGDSVKTAAQMGHKQGDDVLFSHYRKLVRPGEGSRYFSLHPNKPDPVPDPATSPDVLSAV